MSSAAGIYSFAVASGVPVTGVAGVCAILYRLFGIPMGLSNVLINIPIILFSYKVLGKSFSLRSRRRTGAVRRVYQTDPSAHGAGLHRRPSCWRP